MYHLEYAEIYDRLHESKDYLYEVNFIQEALKRNKSDADRILDIGCGTGTHSLLLCQRDYTIVGIDDSKQMIDIANRKAAGRPNIEFSTKRITQVDGDFDLAISMFNVVNHIHDMDRLTDFYDDIRTKLVPGGLFIFDCWNGVAALRDPPIDRVLAKKCQDGTIMEIETVCKTDLMRQETDMLTNVHINDNIVKYGLKHTLWTPRQHMNILDTVGFKIINICKAHDLSSPANAGDYKIAFVCEVYDGY